MWYNYGAEWLLLPLPELWCNKRVLVKHKLTREEFEHLKTSGVDITLLSFPQGKHLPDNIDFWGDVHMWLKSVSAGGGVF